MASLVNERLLNALAIKESHNNPKAVGDGGKAIGAYQMWPMAYQDVQQTFPQDFGKIPYAQLKTDRNLQRKAAEAYLRVGEQKYGITDRDRLISFYNAGPRARQGALINPSYVQGVNALLQQEAPMPTSVEDTLFDIDQVLHQKGHGSMDAHTLKEVHGRLSDPQVQAQLQNGQLSVASIVQEVDQALGVVKQRRTRQLAPAQAQTSMGQLGGS